MPAEWTSAAMPHLSIAASLRRKPSRPHGSPDIADWVLPGSGMKAAQLLLPSSMPRLIKLCISQSRPMKPAVTINRVKVRAVVRGLKSYSDCAATFVEESPSSTL